MAKALGFVFLGLGVLLVAANLIPTVQNSLKVVPGISVLFANFYYVVIAALILIVIGGLLLRNSGGSASAKQEKEEVPIYKGNKIVGYRKE